ncbi:MAG TPA: hypothetical protein VH560_12965 [Polyangia bacterium]|nr:hypothetical protein [Polyangia bacterium]
MIGTRDDAARRNHAASGAIGWLGLAAAPTFAIMALVSWRFGADTDTMCAVLHGGSPLSGMTAMYVLMSAFHGAPWLTLILRDA